MAKRGRRAPRLILAVMVAAVSGSASGVPAHASPAESSRAQVTLAEDGEARLPIAAPSQTEPAGELERYLERICGGDFKRTAFAEPDRAAIHVGLLAEFPWLEQGTARKPDDEEYLLKSDGRSVYLVGATPAGVRHAVATFLHRLGCRWFFPGRVWEVIPARATIRGDWNERSSPSFRTQRRIWYGFGAYAPERAALEEWNRHNRMGGPVAVHIGHTWHGLDPQVDFAKHPEWFALSDGRRQPSKPCYSHPSVAERAIESALRHAALGSMVSMSPPDGLGYCECQRCLAVFGDADPFRAHSSLFARRPDGRTVNITSETLFAFVNRVAAAVAREYPKTLVGCYAYSAYSHPPSFALHPNVYLQTTTRFRRTPLELEEQITEFGRLASQVGIREYYSVYQWDWDEPEPGNVVPRRLQADLRLYRSKGITAINAEASNNWAPRGLGYYVASRLMWDVDADVRNIVRDFYVTAFGDAAEAMERYYVRWYGDDVAVLSKPPTPPAKRSPSVASPADSRRTRSAPGALEAAFHDLDDAARLVADSPPHRARVDQLRLYLHYLLLRRRVETAEASGDSKAVLDAIRAETEFGGRLTRTGMIHSRALLGKAFLRRFRKHAKLLESVPEAANWGKGWRRVGAPPTRDELESLWEEGRAAF